ncbi:hypothetical protein F5B22DRAFT_605632 [Xylaria bambusicola]|uniref:uncharacterized protein n=1 Tax=Xylaria bambusicola TaxID=326684 RepID=UPI00200827EE|nr:uncharacterized protein F5B22DRAFT_605632 [Xylaria bambusicola]KAI0516948.1 hypothetical protein F5B22DRAFT_605632 [Xylaria bambusicola]
MMEDNSSDYDDNLSDEAEGFPPRPQLPESVKSGAFSYDSRNGLRVSNFSRASLEDLTLLFRKNASSARRAVATKPWLTAQLRLYDIAFNKSAKVSELRGTLEAAVKGRKCVEGGPPSIDLIRQRLATQFAQKQEEYAQAVKKHKLDVKSWHKQNFSKLSDPSAEARYDIGWFVSKYFVNDDGSPAPNKTPEPVIIWDLDKPESLRHRIDGIPGLRARVTGYLAVIAWDSAFKRGIGDAFTLIDRPDVKGDHPTLEALFDPELFLAKYFLDGLHGRPKCEKQKKPLALKPWFAYGNSIEKLKQAVNRVPELLIQETERPTDDAWNRSGKCIIVGWAKSVKKLAHSWKLDIARLEDLDIKQKRLDEEKEIMAKLKPHTDYIREKRPLPSGPFTLKHLVGSYMVQCPLLEEEYMCQGTMTLDIHPSTSTNGTAGAFDFGLLEGTMLISTSEASLERLREEEAARSDSDEEVSDLDSLTVSGKRKFKSSQGATTKHSKKRPGGIEGSRNPSRFYLQWAGLDTGTGDLVLDADHERTGHFDLDSTGMTAQGQFFYRGLQDDKPFVFTLLKVADEPRKHPDAWSSYCEKVRWRHW